MVMEEEGGDGGVGGHRDSAVLTHLVELQLRLGVEQLHIGGVGINKILCTIQNECGTEMTPRVSMCVCVCLSVFVCLFGEKEERADLVAAPHPFPLLRAA